MKTDLTLLIAHCNFTNEHKTSLDNYFKTKLIEINPIYIISNPALAPKNELESIWGIEYTKNLIQNNISNPQSMVIVSKTVYFWLKTEKSYNAENLFSIPEEFKAIEILSLIKYYSKRKF